MSERENMYGEHIGMLAFIKSPFMYLHLLDPSLAGLFSFLAEKSVANNLGFRCTQRKFPSSSMYVLLPPKNIILISNDFGLSSPLYYQPSSVLWCCFVLGSRGLSLSVVYYAIKTKARDCDTATLVLQQSSRQIKGIFVFYTHRVFFWESQARMCRSFIFPEDRERFCA